MLGRSKPVATRTGSRSRSRPATSVATRGVAVAVDATIASGAQHPRGIRQPEVVGPEVVPPLRHAVGLVDHEQADPAIAHAVEEAGSGKALRRDVEQPQLAGGGAPQRLRVDGGILLGVDQRDPIAQPARRERLDLVLHQRDQRRDHHREVVAQQRRQLVAERLARAGGHHHEHVAARESRLARLALAGPEAREAKLLAENAVEVHRGHPSAADGGSFARGRRVVTAARKASRKGLPEHLESGSRRANRHNPGTLSPASRPPTGSTPAELRLATRNHGLPLEALAHDITPIGLHYLLIHYDIPFVDPAAWRLAIGGFVEQELSLSLDDLRSRPSVTLPVTLECAGNGRAGLEPRPLSQPWLLEAVGTAEWTGVPLCALLDEAGLRDGATEVLFRGLDRGFEGGLEDGEEQHYERSLPIVDALAEEVLLAYEMNGMPLPPQHGAPLRLVVPGWYGMASVKWLERITVLDQPFEGWQQVRSYRFRQTPDEVGEPVSRMLPRSLMVPPGIPDFFTRERTLRAGPCTVRGRAWSGHGTIERVEVSADGGASWSEARLGEQPAPSAWLGWDWDWAPEEPGLYELCCRCADSAGNEQPLAPQWNLLGYANTGVQRVPVRVTA